LAQWSFFLLGDFGMIALRAVSKGKPALLHEFRDIVPAARLQSPALSNKNHERAKNENTKSKDLQDFLGQGFKFMPHV